MLLAYSLQPAATVHAEDLNSSNYEIRDFTVGNLGDQLNSANYIAEFSIAEVLGDDRFNSANYRLEVGVNNTWRANVPLVECFETTTSGATSCSDPDVAGGMVQICGDGGCYDRARFEIDAQLNPVDTLYAVRITTDVTWATWDYIDAATFTVEPFASHDIDNYQTETLWEGTASNFNIFGLDEGIDYYIQLTALHGDLTESEVSPAATAKTGLPEVSFDIDIDDITGGAPESAAPYTLDLGILTITEVTTAADLIWFDIGTNMNGGTLVRVRDTNGGLFSTSNAYTLTSANADLASVPGYGLVGNSVSETYLGPIAFSGDYTGPADNIGGLITNVYGKPLLTTSGPVSAGRASVYVKGRPALDSPVAEDYTDGIILTVGADLN